MEYFKCHHQNCLTCNCTTKEEKKDALILYHANTYSHPCKNHQHQHMGLHMIPYLAKKPIWAHDCRLNLDDNLKKKIIYVFSLLNLTCTCTTTKRCSLCFWLCCSNPPTIYFDYDHTIKLDTLFLLFPYINWNLDSV